ncbi:MAG: hypothetical protein BWX50_01321 [Euryarchaeota archaeon ADurb.Bin009]|nr:MAG: hypothetical protein BWX50_01321 [Euryarchaeota archaeon ADurb.Bin009]
MRRRDEDGGHDEVAHAHDERAALFSITDIEPLSSERVIRPFRDHDHDRGFRLENALRKRDHVFRAVDRYGIIDSEQNEQYKDREDGKGDPEDRCDPCGYQDAEDIDDVPLGVEIEERRRRRGSDDRSDGSGIGGPEHKKRERREDIEECHEYGKPDEEGDEAPASEPYQEEQDQREDEQHPYKYQGICNRFRIFERRKTRRLHGKHEDDGDHLDGEEHKGHSKKR